MRNLLGAVVALTAFAVGGASASSVRAVATTPQDIVFVRGLYKIWAMSPDGTDQRQLTSSITDFPRWSPDRRWIAYTGANVQGAAVSQEIWLMHPDGSGKHQLTHLYPAQAVGLSWSPDGRQIAFARDVKLPR